MSCFTVSGILKIIVSSEMAVTAYTSVNSVINTTGMTRQLQPIDVSVNIPLKDHLWKRFWVVF